MAQKVRIAVIGAGLMGHGIAQVFALAGHDVTITDQHKPALDSARQRIATNLRDLGDDERAVERVRPIGGLADCVRDADFVVEAVLEDMPLKQKIFGEIEMHVRPDTILASNTSVMPITEIMQGLKRRERALGTHWWNPPFLVPLVEVIGTQWTSQAAIDYTMKLHADAGKCRRTSKRTCRVSSATGFSTPCGARRSRWSSAVSATPKPSIRSSRRRSAGGCRCSVRWKMPI